MSNKFTPGPWQVTRERWRIEIRQVNPQSGLTGYIASLESKTQDIRDANLIAAAPDLYEALIALTDFPEGFFDRSPDNPVTITVLGGDLIAARAALKKARGES